MVEAGMGNSGHSVSCRSRVAISQLALGMLVMIGAQARSAAAEPAKNQGKAQAQAALATLATANFYYKNSQFKKAAARYHEAYSIDPRPEFLFNAARSEQRAVMLVEAEAHFTKCLALDGISPAIADRARLHLAEVRAVKVAIAAARERERAAASGAAGVNGAGAHAQDRFKNRS